MTTNRIAFQGEPGAYSHEACRSARPGMEALPCRTFEDVIEDRARRRRRSGDAAGGEFHLWPGGRHPLAAARFGAADHRRGLRPGPHQPPRPARHDPGSGPRGDEPYRPAGPVPRVPAPERHPRDHRGRHGRFRQGGRRARQSVAGRAGQCPAKGDLWSRPPGRTRSSDRQNNTTAIADLCRARPTTAGAPSGCVDQQSSGSATSRRRSTRRWAGSRRTA